MRLSLAAVILLHLALVQLLLLYDFALDLCLLDWSLSVLMWSLELAIAGQSLREALDCVSVLLVVGAESSAVSGLATELNILLVRSRLVRGRADLDSFHLDVVLEPLDLALVDQVLDVDLLLGLRFAVLLGVLVAATRGLLSTQEAFTSRSAFLWNVTCPILAQ